MPDWLRFAVGTLTAWPIGPPHRVDRSVTAFAMSCAPVVMTPLLVALGVVVAVLGQVHAAPAVVAALLVTVVVLSSRGLHLDGLADTADGLSAGYDRAKALEVMRRGDIGPSGVCAIVLTLLVQAAAVTDLVAAGRGLWLAAVALLTSRHLLAWACRDGLPPARREGLGAAVAGTVPTRAAVAALAVTCLIAVPLGVAGGARWWEGPAVVAAGLAGGMAVLARAQRRLGGVTGDVLGATVEVSFTAALVVASLFV